LVCLLQVAAEKTRRGFLALCTKNIDLCEASLAAGLPDSVYAFSQIQLVVSKDTEELRVKRLEIGGGWQPCSFDTAAKSNHANATLKLILQKLKARIEHGLPFDEPKPKNLPSDCAKGATVSTPGCLRAEEEEQGMEPRPSRKRKDPSSSSSLSSDSPQRKKARPNPEILRNQLTTLLGKIKKLLADITANKYKGTKQPLWTKTRWRRKVQVVIGVDCTIVGFKSSVWKRNTFNCTKKSDDDWRPDTVEAIASGHKLDKAALWNLLNKLCNTIIGALRTDPAQPLKKKTRTETTQDGAKTRSGLTTKGVVSSTDTVSRKRCLSRTDIITGVSHLVTQTQGILCPVNACVNPASGVVTLQQVMDFAESDIPTLGQTRQCFRNNGVRLFEPAWFKLIKSQGPVYCLAVFANAVEQGSLNGRRFAIKCADAHWLSVIVKNATEAIIIDSDPSNPEPIPFTKDNLLNMGYVGVVDVLELVLTKQGKARLKQLLSV
jgi:hypothetical protein